MYYRIVCTLLVTSAACWPFLFLHHFQCSQDLPTDLCKDLNKSFVEESRALREHVGKGQQYQFRLNFKRRHSGAEYIFANGSVEMKESSSGKVWSLEPKNEFIWVEPKPMGGGSTQMRFGKEMLDHPYEVISGTYRIEHPIKELMDNSLAAIFNDRHPDKTPKVSSSLHTHTVCFGCCSIWLSSCFTCLSLTFFFSCRSRLYILL